MVWCCFCSLKLHTLSKKSRITIIHYLTSGSSGSRSLLSNLPASPLTNCLIFVNNLFSDVLSPSFFAPVCAGKSSFLFYHLTKCTQTTRCKTRTSSPIPLMPAGVAKYISKSNITRNCFWYT